MSPESHRYISEEGGAEANHVEPSTAILFPWFAEFMGVVVFYFLSRYVRRLPYTAVMFVIGTMMGIAAVKYDLGNALHDSVNQWIQINGELLLGIFLPGLIFRDAIGLNFHLFTQSLSQILMLAFPMVLAGTSLTALVAYYIFPYNWSFDLSMTFGSILSATDPVAISALLNEVGAPPRLKIHVSGESLFNDGSAIVFYTIFKSKYLLELGIEGLGDDVNLKEGVALFFREALGGSAMGIAFGLGLILVLYFLDRHLEDEENVIQVAATITTAYLAYFSADLVHMSGVMCVVMCGITTQAFGSSMINDGKLMDNFWALVEHLLNVLLFTLGGAVWGTVIAQSDVREEEFKGKDWGYLLLLYVLLNVIRFFLMFIFYPINSRIGLKSNLRETFFSAFGGLRGAIGIALALALDSEVREATEAAGKSFEFRVDTNLVFGMVGGVALLTLILNGTLAGPLLRALHLADSTENRKRIVKGVHRVGIRHLVEDFIELLADERFQNVDFASVKYHIPDLSDLTFREFKSALLKHKKNMPVDQYKAPYVHDILPYLMKGAPYEETSDMAWLEEIRTESPEPTASYFGPTESMELPQGEKERTKELRYAFLTLLRSTYGKQVVAGELDGREGFVSESLFQGLDFASDAVSRGEPLRDWEFALAVNHQITDTLEKILDQSTYLCSRISESHVPIAHVKLRIEVHRTLAFVKAHKVVQELFKKELCEAESEFAVAEKLVLHESRQQVRDAEEMFRALSCVEVDAEVSHLFCIILLNKQAAYVKSLADSGVLKPREAGAYNEEIEERLEILTKYCSDTLHPGQLSPEEKQDILRGAAEEKVDEIADVEQVEENVGN